MWNLRVLLASSLLCSVAFSQAAPIPALMEILDDTFSETEAAMEKAEPQEPPFFSPGEFSSELVSRPAPAHTCTLLGDFEFSVFWLRIRANAGFEVPGFAKILVVPEMELLWQKQSN